MPDPIHITDDQLAGLTPRTLAALVRDIIRRYAQAIDHAFAARPASTEFPPLLPLPVPVAVVPTKTKTTAKATAKRTITQAQRLNGRLYGGLRYCNDRERKVVLGIREAKGLAAAVAALESLKTENGR